MGLADYIRRKRVHLAKKLLKSDFMVKEVGDMVGINDYNYFSKLFKKETGYSPTEYKKMINDGNG